MWSLYQSLEEASPMRFHVYYTLVVLAGKTEQTSAVFTDVETVKSQFSAVPPSNEQMQKLLRLLHEVLLSCKKSDEASSVRFVSLINMSLRLCDHCQCYLHVKS